MEKITAYGQIPEFTPDGNYQVDMEPKYLMGWIREAAGIFISTILPGVTGFPRELITNMSAWTGCSGSPHGSGISTGRFRFLAAMSMNLQTGSPAAGPCISTSMNCLQKKPSCNGIWT